LPAVDREAPLRFLRTAFHPDDWVAIFLKSYETGLVAQRVGPLDWVMHPRFQAWLRFKNAQRYNVYVSVNAIQPGRRSRSREAIGAIRHVFLEADHDGPAVLAKIASRPDLPEPSYVLHSSPHRVHVFWRVAGFDPREAEALQRQLAREIGSDPAATPASQTTRLPGLLNHKYSPPAFVTIEYRSLDHIYAPAEFPIAKRKPSAVRAGLLPHMSAGRLSALERARRYVTRVPPAVAGEHGDIHTFRICCRLVRAFALDDEDALAVLANWNVRCRPPWSDRELRDKVRRARRYGREPMAGLLRRTP
jgi:hypothetical protein